jgi:hypothetical protein
MDQWEEFIHPRSWDDDGDLFDPGSFDFPIWDSDGDSLNFAAHKLGGLVAVEVDRVEDA